jgi:hypothetical protein
LHFNSFLSHYSFICCVASLVHTEPRTLQYWHRR